MNHTTHQHPRAFTLVELLVSVGIAAFLMTLITVTVSQTVKVTRIGRSTSKMITKSQVVSEQLRADFEGQLGPKNNIASGECGFMVIVQQEIDDTEEFDTFETPQPRTDKVRSDQIFFFYDNSGTVAEKLTPICPSDNNTFKPVELDNTENQACIWYGHLMPTNRKGTAAADTVLAGANTIRSDMWMLGRQALFMAPTITSTHYQTALNVSGTINYTTSPIPSALIPTKMSMGLVDIVKQSHENILTNVDSVTGETASDYYDYIKDNAVYGPINRLWANPIPYLDMGDSNYKLNSWQIAQSHPIFMDNVSDFAIEFALDTNDNGEADVDVDGSGNIIWYSRYDTNGPDVKITKLTTLKIPDSTTSDTSKSFYHSFTDTSTTPPVSAEYIVFRHNDTGLNNRWPVLLRFRYRIHDKNGHLVDPDGKSGIWTETIVKVNR